MISIVDVSRISTEPLVPNSHTYHESKTNPFYHRTCCYPVSQAVKFNGHWYAVFPEGCNWETANKKCERLGGHLAFVETQEENSFILGLIEKSDFSGDSAWLGGTDKKDEGDWLWLNGKPIINPFWGKDQPSNGNSHEHYLVMFCGKSAQSLKGKWDDVYHNGQRAVVCEWE